MGVGAKVVVLAVAAIGGAGCGFTVRVTGGPIISDTGHVGAEGSLVVGFGKGLTDRKAFLISTRMGLGVSPERENGTFRMCLGGDYVHESPGDRWKAFRAGGGLCRRSELDHDPDYTSVALEGEWYVLTYASNRPENRRAHYFNVGVDVQPELLLNDDRSVAEVWTFAGISLGLTSFPKP